MYRHLCKKCTSSKIYSFILQIYKTKDKNYKITFTDTLLYFFPTIFVTWTVFLNGVQLQGNDIIATNVITSYRDLVWWVKLLDQCDYVIQGSRVIGEAAGSMHMMALLYRTHVQKAKNIGFFFLCGFEDYHFCLPEIDTASCSCEHGPPILVKPEQVNKWK